MRWSDDWLSSGNKKLAGVRSCRSWWWSPAYHHLVSYHDYENTSDDDYNTPCHHIIDIRYPRLFTTRTEYIFPSHYSSSSSSHHRLSSRQTIDDQQIRLNFLLLTARMSLYLLLVLPLYFFLPFSPLLLTIMIFHSATQLSMLLVVGYVSFLSPSCVAPLSSHIYNSSLIPHHSIKYIYIRGKNLPGYEFLTHSIVITHSLFRRMRSRIEASSSTFQIMMLHVTSSSEWWIGWCVEKRTTKSFLRFGYEICWVQLMSFDKSSSREFLLPSYLTCCAGCSFLLCWFGGSTHGSQRESYLLLINFLLSFLFSPFLCCFPVWFQGRNFWKGGSN